MKTILRLSAAAGFALAATISTAAGVSAATSSPGRDLRDGAVFVQSDDPAGNTVTAYHRNADGTLRSPRTSATGGLGGVLTGSVVDHLASQGSLVQDDGLLYAVNAGSDTITTFAVRGDDLTRRQVVSSGGDFPVSVAASGRKVYVLNARGGGSIQGYLRAGDRLVRVPAWHRELGLDATATPEFTHTAGQIGFTPDGSKLVVTTKAASNSIVVFDVTGAGAPGRPVVTADPGNVPFGFTFDARGRLAVSEAGPNAVATFAISRSGAATLVDRATTGQAATCWVVRSESTLFASNAGSGTFSNITVHPDASLRFLGNTVTDRGTVDAAATPDGRFLYVQAGAAGLVNGFSLAGTSPSAIGTVTVPGAVGGQGIVAN